MHRFKRADRVNSLLQEEISRIISRELKDPRLGFVSVTRVEVSPDLRHARVQVSPLGSEEQAANSLAALQRAAGYVHELLLGRLEMRRVPQLTFALDRNIQYGVEMAARLSEIVGADAAARPPADPTPADGTAEEEA